MAKVYLSPSTQEWNKGVGAYGTEEYRMNQIADVVEGLLKYNGFTVVRNKPEMSLNEVVADSNKQKPDIHVAIHSNAGGGSGTEVWAYLVKGKITNSQKLAQCLYNKVAPLTPSPDRGIKDGVAAKLAEVIKVKATSCIIEVAFHDNPSDANYVINHINDIGKAIAEGICDYFGVQMKVPQPQQPEQVAPQGKFYRVQLGAFRYKNGAETMLERLKKAGFDGFIKLE